MKKIITCTFAIFAFAGCSSDNLNTSDQSSKSMSSKEIRLTPIDFKTVGESHNKVLDNIYDYWFDNKTETKSLEDLSNQKNVFYTSYFNQNKYDKFLLNLVNNPSFVKIIDLNHFEFTNKEITENSEKSLLKLDKYFSLLEKAVSNSSIKDINKLENDLYYDSQFNNQDLYYFYHASSVAKHSIVYWYDNNKKWIDLVIDINKDKFRTKENKKTLSSYDKTIKAWPPNRGWGGEVVKKDVSGAIAGAVTAWWLNAAPAAGQVAYGTVIGSMSAGNSAMALIEELWPWYSVPVNDKISPMFPVTIDTQKIVLYEYKYN
ncbi:hypothetical protein [Myroides odoratus]|uniref:hypothetical protein n=1 Tax=Myroides odoratus TaxID=256 RepID=UPI0039AFD27F